MQAEWVWKQQERIDFINKQFTLERKVEANFEELNDAIREYHMVFGYQLQPLPEEPVLSNFYTLSKEQHNRELVFMVLSMIGIVSLVVLGRLKQFCFHHNVTFS